MHAELKNHQERSAAAAMQPHDIASIAIIAGGWVQMCILACL